MTAGGEVRAEPSREAVASLLAACGLHSEDLSDGHMRHFFFSGPAAEPSGVVGLELCGEAALLRSLAVRAACRGTGLGVRLVAHAERHAHAQGAMAMYLLTTTAERFFGRRGYAAVPRDAAPAGIRRTREFADICPASSVFMFKPL